MAFKEFPLLKSWFSHFCLEFSFTPCIFREKLGSVDFSPEDRVDLFFSIPAKSSAFAGFLPHRNEGPCLNVSTAHGMQRLEREMRGLGRRRRTSVPPLLERGGAILPSLSNQETFPQTVWIFSSHLAIFD
jgi:hypothetical protein